MEYLLKIQNDSISLNNRTLQSEELDYLIFRLSKILNNQIKNTPVFTLEEDICFFEESLNLRDMSEGFIYLIKTTDNVHKIGMSKVGEGRILGLKRQYKLKEVEVIILKKVKRHVRCEKYLIEYFQNKRNKSMKGLEWFSFNNEDIIEINKIIDYYNKNF